MAEVSHGGTLAESRLSGPGGDIIQGLPEDQASFAGASITISRHTLPGDRDLSKGSAPVI